MIVTMGFIRDMVASLNATANTNRTPLALELFRDYFGTVDRFQEVRDVPLCPNGLIIFGPRAVVLLIGGVRDDAMRIQIAQGYSDQTAITNAEGFNPWAMKNALEQFHLKLPNRLADGVPFIMVGHSGGSMIVQACNHLQRRHGAKTADVVIVTGAPRPRTFAGPTTWPDAQYFRFMTWGDTVTQLPPLLQEMPYVVAASAGLSMPAPLQGFLNLLNDRPAIPSLGLWPHFVNCPGGTILNSLGLLNEAHELPPIPPATFINGPLTSQLNLLFSLSEHELGVYLTYLDRHINKFGSGEPEEDTFGGDIGGHDYVAEDFYILPVDTGGNITLPNQGGVPMSMGENIQTQTIPDPTGNSKGALYLRGNLVAIFPTRGKAKSAASKLSAFLRRLPKANEVSLSGLRDGATQYLNEAAIGGGIDPRPVKVVS